MSCADKNQNPTLRCGIDAINWAPNAYFKTCPVCGEDCELMCVDEHVLSWHESKRLEAELVAERNAAELAAGAAAPVPQGAFSAADQERRISAATAALHYDLDHWLEADPSAWGPAGELGG